MTRYLPKDKVTRINFRLDEPVKVVVKYENPHHVSLTDLVVEYTVSPVTSKKYPNSPGGYVSQGPLTFWVGSGKYTLLLFGRDLDADGRVLATVDTTGKKEVTVTCTIPARFH